MSFIYEDPELIDKLVFSGLDYVVKFTKKGQAAAAAVQQDRANLLTHIKNLQSQLQDTPTISHEGEDTAKPQLVDKNLESLGDLVQWLVANKITVNGGRVAYGKDEKPPGDGKGWIPYDLETHKTTVDQRGAAPDTFKVQPALLKTFIVSLQAQAANSDNQAMKKWMNFKLGQLIQEANRDLGTEIDTKYQAPENIRDNDVLDRIPQNLVDANTSVTGGNIAFTYADSKDYMSFNKFLSDNNISMKDAGPQGQQLGFNHPKYNRCGILNILMARAKYKYQAARSVDEKNLSTIYMRQVSTIAEQVPGGCDLSGRGEKGSADMQGGQGHGQQGAGGNQDELITQIINDLPLQQADVNFDRIRRFMESLGKLMGNNPTINTLIQQTNNMMVEVSTKYMDAPETVFQLGISPEALVGKFKEKQFPGRYFPRVVQLLDQIVDNTASLVRYFLSAYSRPLSQRPEELQYIYGQIGNAPGDESIYNDNVRALNDWARTPVTTSSRV